MPFLEWHDVIRVREPDVRFDAVSYGGEPEIADHVCGGFEVDLFFM